MLNAASKTGIIEILSLLDDDTIKSLANTVTQGLLKNLINCREDAINAILNYSPDALNVLRRKVITKEVLLSYIHQKAITIDLPVTKIGLMQKIASVWNILYTDESAENLNTPLVDSGSVSQLAEQFAQWFYTMLNKDECMDHHHFYPDAKLQINITNNGHFTCEIIESDPQKIVQRLLLLRMNYNLFFNPNLSAGGVQGKVDPHGLVLVLVCGTLHVQGGCVGVFEQVFALVRDPQEDNNWRIRSTELNLKSQDGITGLPTLESNHYLALS